MTLGLVKSPAYVEQTSVGPELVDQAGTPVSLAFPELVAVRALLAAGGTGGQIAVRNAGVNLGNAAVIDFTGTGYSLSFAAGVATLTLSAGGGASSWNTLQDRPTALVNTTAAFTNGLEIKLNGIEPGATADMTGGEIVTAINSALGSTDWQTGGSGSVTLGSMTTAANSGDATAKAAFVTAIGLPSGEVTVAASRSITATDANQVLRVSNGQALTLEIGSLPSVGSIVTMAPDTGAVYTVIVNAATLRTRVGGAALANGSVISSAMSRDGTIMIGKEPDGSYLLLSPTQNEVFAAITASAVFPNRTNEHLARYFVNVASGNVVLTIAAGQFPADPQMSGVEIVVLGGGTNTCTVAAGASVTLQVQGSASAGSGKSIIVRCDPVAANTPRVAA
jgi:hypothetical protein